MQGRSGTIHEMHHLIPLKSGPPPEHEDAHGQKRRWPPRERMPLLAPGALYGSQPSSGWVLGGLHRFESCFFASVCYDFRVDRTTMYPQAAGGGGNLARSRFGVGNLAFQSPCQIQGRPALSSHPLVLCMLRVSFLGLCFRHLSHHQIDQAPPCPPAVRQWKLGARTPLGLCINSPSTLLPCCSPVLCFECVLCPPPPNTYTHTHLRKWAPCWGGGIKWEPGTPPPLPLTADPEAWAAVEHPPFRLHSRGFRARSHARWRRRVSTLATKLLWGEWTVCPTAHTRRFYCIFLASTIRNFLQAPSLHPSPAKG